MAINSQHPDYCKFSEDWQTMRDTYEGERVVKEAGTTYLPATSGMTIDGLGTGQVGAAAYEAYKLRAVFPDYVREGVEALVGMMHQKPPVIELPSALEPLRGKATITGESLDLLLRKINVEQLITGRLGLLLDLPSNPDPSNPIPYIASYDAEALINWDDGELNEKLNLIVLNESCYVRDSNFDWQFYNRYRVLKYGTLGADESGENLTYSQGIFSNEDGNDESYREDTMIQPAIRGVTLNEIPFAIINSKDIATDPDQPPLIGLARLCLAIYRAEADYRHSLFMQGQDTLIIVGGTRNSQGSAGEEDAIRTGAGSRIEVEMGGDAKYIGVDSTGLAEQRLSLENDRRRAQMKAGKLIDESGSMKASGEALKTRFSAQTATLNQIALSGAAGLEKILKIAAKWVGANPDEVKVIPNLEFADFGFNAQEIVYLMTARKLGAPISLESIHQVCVDRGITRIDFEKEISKYEAEIETELKRAAEFTQKPDQGGSNQILSEKTLPEQPQE